MKTGHTPLFSGHLYISGDTKKVNAESARTARDRLVQACKESNIPFVFSMEHDTSYVASYDVYTGQDALNYQRGQQLSKNLDREYGETKQSVLREIVEYLEGVERNPGASAPFQLSALLREYNDLIKVDLGSIQYHLLNKLFTPTKRVEYNSKEFTSALTQALLEDRFDFETGEIKHA